MAASNFQSGEALESCVCDVTSLHLFEGDILSNYSDQVLENLEAIQTQNENIQVQLNLLEIEKVERLKFHTNDDVELSESLLNFDSTLEKIAKVKELKPKPKKETTPKSFLNRNVQLAGSKMSKFNLTDEEKQQLDIILSNIDETNLSEETYSENAFSISETHKKRILDIDFNLRTYFNDTENLKVSSICLQLTHVANSEQMLKEIDNKLNQLKEKERK